MLLKIWHGALKNGKICSSIGKIYILNIALKL